MTEVNFFVTPESFNKVLDILENKYDFSEGSFVYAYVDEGKRDYVENLFLKLHQNDDNKYSESVYLSALLELLVILDMYSVENVTAASGFMAKAIEYISSNSFLDLDIDKIASAASVSKYHFCHQFKKNMGMPVMEYVLNTRIVMAKNMLLKENVSVTEVSSRCGFSSISYFSRVFKEKTGVTPLSYRKQKKQQS